MSSPNSKVKTLTVLICGHCSFKPLCPQRANREKILPQQVKTAKHILTITFHFIFNSLNTKLDLGFFHTVNNLVLIYAPLILPLQERSYTLQLHITPKFFPTMNTKIGLLKKKKKAWRIGTLHVYVNLQKTWKHAAPAHQKNHHM